QPDPPERADMFTRKPAFAYLGSILGSLLARSLAAAAMVPMVQVGPQPRGVDQKAYQHVIDVASGGEHQTVASALASITAASPTNRYAILVAAGTYHESRIAMRQHVDLYGGFAAGDWKNRDVFTHATILDAEQKGPV